MSNPLKGIRVIDASSMVAGPMSTQILADQGAEVIKIEPPVGGDLCRFIGAMHGGVSHYFCVYNRNKRSLTLDLKQSRGREILQQLLSGADLFIHNFRPEAAKRLGLDINTLHQAFPQLVCAAISGFGTDGPYAGRRVYDPLVQGVSGIAVSQGSADDPQLIRQLICDKVSGLYMAQAMSAALLARERTGEGQVLDMSLLDASLGFSFPEIMGEQVFVADSDPAPDMSVVYKPWATADGSLAVVLLSAAEFAGWCRALNCEQLINDPRFADTPARLSNWQLLREQCAARVESYNTADILQRLLAQDVPAAPVNTAAQVLDDPQVHSNNNIHTVNHANAGAVRHARTPVSFNSRPSAEIKPAPLLGEHSEMVLSQLGYSDEDISQLFAKGISSGQRG